MNLQIIHVIMMIRHGHRCPLRMLAQVKDLQGQAGYLTPLGKERAFQKGKEIWAVYKDLITNKNDISIISSNFPRNIETAFFLIQSFLGNSFNNKELIKDQINFLSQFKLYRKYQAHDILYHGYFNFMCPNSQKLFHENNLKAFEKKQHIDLIKKHKNIIESFYPNFESGKEIYLSAYYVYDFANSVFMNQIALPSPLT